MGGDIVSPPGEDSSSDQGLSQLSSPRLRDGLSMKAESCTSNEGDKLLFQQFDEMGQRNFSASLDLGTDQRRRENVFREIFRSYDELRIRSQGLEEAKSKILGYTPGSWIEKVGSLELSDYDVPPTTSLILVGPKGSGKSSLVNRISKVFEDDKFASERAQEYMIPRGSTSFCLYDTRSLSNDSHDNIEMLKHWMTRGVRHGELIIRNSDGPSLRTRMKFKAIKNSCVSSERRKVNFVIFVVNGLSVLKSMINDEDADKQYTELIASAFNCPYVSFRDDKPLIVVSHGDLLSRFDRARVRIHLGELLGIPPTKQIFDIPDKLDPETELRIVDMLRYSLEHADKNLPPKPWFMNKMNKLTPWVLKCADCATVHAGSFSSSIINFAFVIGTRSCYHFGKGASWAYSS
ncbi:AAA-type ATPase [Trema orientale]|uniref:AAA-type ATPase n=1 Tax=Trema orientale TaxID=63057 RepID=A0A2P5CE62_TREOI|nr:AAA-type ATPase [Trema orientale]